MKEICCKYLLALTLVVGMARALCAQEVNAAHTIEQLRQEIEAHVTQPKFSAAAWGIKIVALDSGKTIFEYHPDRLLSPASNSKLYTGSLGLMQLGGDYRFATSIYAAGKVNALGTLEGNLVIVGHGDPSWNERRLGTNFWTPFEPFIAVLTNAGVRRVTGDLIADATYFHGQSTGSSWTIDDLHDGEVGMISALTLDDNVTSVRVEPGASAGESCKVIPTQPGTDLVYSNLAVTVAVGAAAHLDLYRPLDGNLVYILGQLPVGNAAQFLDVVVPRPADWFANALKLALAQHGITISGEAHGVAWPQKEVLPADDAAVKLGTVFSPPLREVVRNFMKPSQNLEADTLLADVGEVTRAANASPWETSEEAGLIALRGFLAAAGVTPGDVRFDEGSGLSRNNLTTARATVALLEFMAKHGEADDFIASLPVGGVDGSLRRRFRNTLADGNVRAKTGTLRWAHALSGYVTTAGGEQLAFSIMLNRCAAPPGHSGHEEIDPIVLMLAKFAGRVDPSQESKYSPLGTLVMTQFVSAPFPHPARSAGHRYHDEFYSAAEHYSDSTVAMFVPKGFHASDKVDFLVHFHGWRHTVAGTLDEYKLIDQFADSERNAILIVPQGPKDAPDSFGGKLEDTNGFKVFMDEAMGKLRASGILTQTNIEIGQVILSGHSGGYHVMAAILDHGGMSANIREVWLFDALYGGTDNFVAWQKQQDGRLLDIYTDHGGTKEETQNLMASYRASGTPFFTAEDTNAVPQNLLTNKIVFLHTDMVHNDVVAKRGTFEEFLKTSCLQNRYDSDHK